MPSRDHAVVEYSVGKYGAREAFRKHHENQPELAAARIMTADASNRLRSWSSRFAPAAEPAVAANPSLFAIRRAPLAHRTKRLQFRAGSPPPRWRHEREAPRSGVALEVQAGAASAKTGRAGATPRGDGESAACCRAAETRISDSGVAPAPEERFRLPRRCGPAANRRTRQHVGTRYLIRRPTRYWQSPQGRNCPLPTTRSALRRLGPRC